MDGIELGDKEFLRTRAVRAVKDDRTAGRRAGGQGERLGGEYHIRTYAVARLCANVACSNPRNSTFGPARNC